MDGHEPLQGHRHRHEDGAGHGHHVQRVEEVGEHVDVQIGHQLEPLPHTLQDGSEEIGVVVDGQRDQEEVEAVPHRFGGQDDAGETVAGDAEDGHEAEEDALAPIGEGGHQKLVGLGELRTVQLLSRGHQIDRTVVHHILLSCSASVYFRLCSVLERKKMQLSCDIKEMHFLLVLPLKNLTHLVHNYVCQKHNYVCQNVACKFVGDPVTAD